MSELRSLVDSLHRAINLPLTPVPQADYMKPAYVRRLALFINVGIDPMEQLSEQGLMRLSDRTDSLVYSSQRYNLVKTIDQLALNSWNELSTGRYELGETLMQTLQAYLVMCAAQMDEPECQLEVFCFSSARADAIAERVRRLFEDVRKRFFQNQGLVPIRYVLEIEERFYVVQWVEQQFRYQAYASRSELFAYLAKPVPSYSPVVFDRYALLDESLMLAALRRNRPGVIQVFYLRHAGQLEVCILDESGSLLRVFLPMLEDEALLSSIDEFLQTIIERRQLDQTSLGRDQLPELEYFVAQESAKSAEGVRVSPHKKVERMACYPITATAFYDGMQLHCDLNYEGREFSYAEYGDEQAKALRHYLRSQEGFDDRLPLALVDLSYPSDPMLMRHSQELDKSVLDYLWLYAQITTQLSIAEG